MTLLRRTPDVPAGILMAAVLVAAAFLAGGATDLGANTTVQVGLLVIAAGGMVAVLGLGARGRAWGAPALALFAALAALTYASIAWSIDPGTSWLEANRTLSYLAAFAAAAALARLFPGRWRAMVAAVATAATAVGAYALVVKVYPATLDPGDLIGRLRVPLGYWNAVGVMAAMGIPACLGAGASTDSPRWLRILCPPAIAVLISALLMSFSRGALVVGIIGGLAWFAVVPVRLRATALLAVGGAGGAAIAGWALPNHNLTADHVAQAARTTAGHAFGVVLLVALALTAVAAWVLAVAMERVALPPRARRRVGIALLAALALVPVVGVVALATSSRGLTGEISHAWSTLTSPNGGAGNRASRLLTLSNNRTRYWSLGLTVGEHHLLAGAGAGGFDVAHRRYSHYQFSVTHAHDFLIQNFADLGLVGVAVSLGLLVAWAVAAGRALGLQRDRTGRLGLRAPPPGGRLEERTGLLTLAAVATVFGLHNLIDWTWFIPGPALVALACAGWLAGRGPLEEPVGLAPEARGPTRAPVIGMAAVGIVALLIGLAWVTIQPLRSSDADNAAISALDAGDSGRALTDSRRAVADDPVALEPRMILSTVYAALGQPGRARAELVQAASTQPDNPAAWQALAAYDLRLHQARLALVELERARELDPASNYTAQLIGQAQG